jgi:hypothetical protein
MRLAKLLLAALLFSTAVYLLTLGGEDRTVVLTAMGVDLTPRVSMVVCIQGLIVGLILGVQAIFEKTAAHSH